MQRRPVSVTEAAIPPRVRGMRLKQRPEREPVAAVATAPHARSDGNISRRFVFALGGRAATLLAHRETIQRRPIAGALCLIVASLCPIACASTAAPTSTTQTGTISPRPVVASASTAIETARPSAIDSPASCDGACPPGQHLSERFDPPLVYTVPEGWFAVEDNPSAFVLKFGSATTDDSLVVFRDPVAHSQEADCPAAADRSVGSSPKELTHWIAALPGLTATRPTAVTVGGLPGFTLAVRIAPTWTHACPYSNGQPSVPLIVSAFPGSDLDWGVGGTGRMRIYALDAGAGRRLWIDVETLAGEDFDELDARAKPVIESFEFSAS